MKLFALHIFSTQWDFSNKPNTFADFEVEWCQQPIETVRQWRFLLLFSCRRASDGPSDSDFVLLIRLKIASPLQRESKSQSRPLSKNGSVASQRWKFSLCPFMEFFFWEADETSPCGDFHHRGRCGSSNDSVIQSESYVNEVLTVW